MPKPMTMTIEVEEIAFGKVFRTLDGMPGVINIRITGSGPKAMAKPNGRGTNGQRQGGTKTVPGIVLGELVKGPRGRPDLAPALERAGKKATSLPDALQKLRKAKAIKTAGKGKGTEYTITPVGMKQYEAALEEVA